MLFRKSLPVILICSLTLHSAAVAQQPARVVFIIADGIPADVIRRVHTPNLDSVSKAGGFAEAWVGGEKDGYSQSPTISAVGYNSLITGTWANKHNVWGNDITAPNYHYKNIFRVLKELRPGAKTAIFSSWLDNRTKLVGHGLPEAGSIFIDFYTDSLEYDTIRFPHDAERKFMNQIDEEVVQQAAFSIEKNGPDLSWIYLEFTDDIGHRHGDSDEFDRAVKILDSQVGTIYTAMKRRSKMANEKWILYVTTDHGRDSATGHNHGGQTNRERKIWIATNEGNLNEHFHSGHATITDIYPTIARDLQLSLPVSVERELDGIPLRGKLSLKDLKASYSKKKITLTWQVIDPEGQAKIYVSSTNRFANGNADQYTLDETLDISLGKATIDVTQRPSKFYKIVVEGKHNVVNQWVEIE